MAIAIAWLLPSTPAIHAQGAWQLDPTFGSGGTTTTNAIGGRDSVHAVAVQADGRIVVAGAIALPNQLVGRFAVARYTSAGVLDLDFGGGGIVTASFGMGEGSSEARAVFLQTDGRIVAAGTVTIAGQQEFAVARFLSNGDPDLSFGDADGGGTVVTGFGTVQDFDVQDTATAILVQSDGRIVVAGGGRLAIPNQPVVSKFNLARYLPDGALDESFGEGGRQVADFTEGEDVAAALLFIPDAEKILAVGTAVMNGTPRVALALFDRFGQPDLTFGQLGKGIASSPVDGATNAVRQPDGKIVVVGSSAGDAAVLRLHPAGDPDATFGNGTGLVTTDFGGPSDRALDVALQPDGAIVIAGQASAADADPANDFAIARYTSDGRSDDTFGRNGALRTDFDGGVDAAFGVTVQGDGRIVAAGITNRGGDESTQDIALARYAPGPDADLRLAKVASTSTVNVGETFSYTVTLTNAGPDAATRVVISDTLPAGIRLISCDAPPDGVCGGTANERRIDYQTVPSGETRTVTFVVAVEASVPNGAAIENTATVSAATFDPDHTNNAATATIAVRNLPHGLRFFLHGTDVPGTAGRFTMNLTPAASQTLTLNLLDAPTWVSDPPLTGTAPAGSTFRLVRPCTIGLGVLVSYRLSKVDANGGAEQTLGQVSGLLGLCTGPQTIVFPVATPVTFNNERLRLTLSSTATVNLNLQLGEGTYLEMTTFTGIP